MPFVKVRDVRLQYDLIGSPRTQDELETVVITLGGRSGINAARRLGSALANRVPGIRVLLWDRRNTNCSGTKYDRTPLVSEDVDDLGALLDKLALSGTKKLILYGCSSGSRVSLMFAVKWPQLVRGLVIAPPTGSDAIEELCEMYYDAPSALAKAKGLSVVAMDIFKDLSEEARSELANVPLDAFLISLEVTKQWMAQFKGQVLIGVTDYQLKELAQESVKIVLVHDGNPNDKLHSTRAVLGLARLIRANKIYVQSGIFSLSNDVCIEIINLLQKEFWPAKLDQSKI